MSKDDAQYDLSPEPPPATSPRPALPAAEEPTFGWRAVKNLDDQERYPWSDRWYFILRRLAGLPLIAGGVWWFWRVRFVAGLFGFSIGAVPVGIGIVLLFYGGPSDAQKKGYRF